MFLFPIRSRLRNYPGRPQLQKISSNSQDGEYETKIEKFQLLLNSAQLDLVALKKLSWSGVPRKVSDCRHAPHKHTLLSQYFTTITIDACCQLAFAIKIFAAIV